MRLHASGIVCFTEEVEEEDGGVHVVQWVWPKQALDAATSSARARLLQQATASGTAAAYGVNADDEVRTRL